MCLKPTLDCFHSLLALVTTPPDPMLDDHDLNLSQKQFCNLKEFYSSFDFDFTFHQHSLALNTYYFANRAIATAYME